jgi:glucose-1-phosphate thymidylyltransferase
MRARDDQAPLTAAQASAADAGIKAMIPIGRPFLDYVLSALADAQLTDVCIVIGPEHGMIRKHYEHTVSLSRLRVRFAVQQEPRGTADALLTAERFAADEPFVVLNGDNYYPAAELARLRAVRAPAVLAFRREGLLRDGHIAPERIAKYAVLDIGADGYVRRVVEKPDQATLSGVGPDAWVSMNCWLFDAEIFRACRAVPPSPRGELELPLAVQHAIDARGMRVLAVCADAGVLDLSHRGDVAAVATGLEGVDVKL